MKWLETFTLVMRSQITTLREKVEDPERMIHQLILDMEEELEIARERIAGAIADEIQLGKEVEKLRKEAEAWMDRATKSLQRGDETAAKSALEQKRRAEDRLESLLGVYETQQEQTRQLQNAFRDLEDKIRQARHKQTLLLARMARAETAQQINRAMDRATGKSAFAQFHRLEQRIERSEAICEAYDRLDGHDFKADELERQLAEQDRKEDLEREFDELKRRVEHKDA
jgi:phage shock protein A